MDFGTKEWWASLSDEQVIAALDTMPPGVLGPWVVYPTGRAGRQLLGNHRGYEPVHVWCDDRNGIKPWRWRFDFESGQARTRELAQKEADTALKKRGWRLQD